ncbi:MAG: hypothetical protein Q4B60_07330 [Erysipelotrichaceae bacterium]|nr:hypothetical protein [Erysipelotrichaceae bacterium]
MLKALIFKQLQELMYSYSRGNKKKDSKKGFSLILFLAGLYLLLAFSMFSMAALLGQPLLSINADWLYYLIMGVMAIVVSTFVNAFQSSAVIYNAKDNDLLLSMPIKPIYIIIARMFTMYISCIAYSSMLWIPSVIFALLYRFDVNVLISGIVLLFVISLIVLILSSLLGYFVAILSRKFKNQAFISVIITLGLLGAYYYFYFNLNNYLNTLLANVILIGGTLERKAFPLYAFGKAATGNYLYLLGVILVVLVLFAILCIFINISFMKVLTSTASEKKKAFNNVYSKKRSAINALMGRELKQFTSISVYMMNCGLGLILMVFAGVFAIIKKAYLLEYVAQFEMISPELLELIPIVILAIMVSIITLNCMAIPSVSLEGNNYWLVRSLPVESRDVLEAKRQIEFKLNIGPAIFMVLCLIYALNIEGLMAVVLIIATVIYTILLSYFHIFLGVKGAKLEWTSVTVPVKQNMNVMIDVFAGFLISFALVGLAYKTMTFIKPPYLMFILMIIALLFIFILNKWMNNKGAREFEKLG